MTPPTDVAAALAAVEQRIVDACAGSGRPRESVRLIAVSKTMPAARVREAVDAGQRLFGENRVQEALDKMPEVGPGAEWHLIGHLQRNKARHAVGRFALIHSVDDPRLARELDKRAGAADRTQPILVQVNVAGETTKSGVSPRELPALVEAVAALKSLELRGLMTIPPPVERPADAAPWFAELRSLRDRTASALGRELPELSMGMTGDFETAIAEGATLIRVGRAIFGERG